MKVLIACEFSGIVREAFARRGHDAWSCDLLPSEMEGQHVQGDVLDILHEGWDLMVAHPPCRFLTLSAARWQHDERPKFHVYPHRQQMALWFFRALLDAPIELIAVENPMSVASTRIRKYDQEIHPWQFGHGETKTTWLWLKNLPLLKPTRIVSGRVERILQMPPGWERSKDRSRTFRGIAEAMATQWV
jgi:hypothetical protein